MITKDRVDNRHTIFRDHENLGRRAASTGACCPQIARLRARVRVFASTLLSMPTSDRRFPLPGVEALSNRQNGVISRPQLIELGMTDGQIRNQIAASRWQLAEPLMEGVYVTHTGPLTCLTRCWAFLLYAGTGAALGLETAEWSWGLRDEPPDKVHIMVPGTRRIVTQKGLRVHIRSDLAARRHPAREPAVTRLDDTVVDLVDDSTTAERAIDVLMRACQKRLTTAGRLRQTADKRKKMKRRRLLHEVLSEVSDGVLSMLERNYRRDVEIAHGLPRGVRNRGEGVAGRRRYRDVRYKKFGVVVELDGQAAHPAHDQDRDDIRDNELLETEGSRTLRYGWKPVAGRACATAAQVGRVLNQGGWTGSPRPCGPDCTIVLLAMTA
jgi:hypothetical protein